MSKQVRTELCDPAYQVEKIKDGLLKCLFAAIEQNGGEMAFTAEELDLEENWAEKLNIQDYRNEFTKKPGGVILSIKK